MARAKKYSELTEKVIRQLADTRSVALDDLRDLAKHGDARSGWSGFIYYTDTHKFTYANYDLIRDAMAEVYGDRRPLSAWMESMHPSMREQVESDMLNGMAWWALEQAAWEVANS